MCQISFWFFIHQHVCQLQSEAGREKNIHQMLDASDQMVSMSNWEVRSFIVYYFGGGLAVKFSKSSLLFVFQQNSLLFKTDIL